MPVVRVEMFPGRTADQKRKFAKAVTDAFVDICKSTPDQVIVIYTEVEKSDWAVAGELASDPKPD